MSNKIGAEELFNSTFDRLAYEAKVVKMVEDVMFKPKDSEFCSHCELDEQEREKDNVVSPRNDG